MGTFFSVYTPVELNTLDQDKRAELKFMIQQVLQHDPDVERLVADKLPALRRMLREKTQGGRSRLED